MILHFLAYTLKLLNFFRNLATFHRQSSHVFLEVLDPVDIGISIFRAESRKSRGISSPQRLQQCLRLNEQFALRLQLPTKACCLTLIESLVGITFVRLLDDALSQRTNGLLRSIEFLNDGRIPAVRFGQSLTEKIDLVFLLSVVSLYNAMRIVGGWRMSTTWPTCVCTHIEQSLEHIPSAIYPILPIFRWNIMKDIEDELKDDESQESQGWYVIGGKLQAGQFRVI
jgi:hypothetical protein